MTRYITTSHGGWRWNCDTRQVERAQAAGGWVPVPVQPKHLRLLKGYATLLRRPFPGFIPGPDYEIRPNHPDNWLAHFDPRGVMVEIRRIGCQKVERAMAEDMFYELIKVCGIQYPEKVDTPDALVSAYYSQYVPPIPPTKPHWPRLRDYHTKELLQELLRRERAAEELNHTP
jgi:hypothetical protein